MTKLFFSLRGVHREENRKRKKKQYVGLCTTQSRNGVCFVLRFIILSYDCWCCLLPFSSLFLFHPLFSLFSTSTILLTEKKIFSSSGFLSIKSLWKLLLFFFLLNIAVSGSHRNSLVIGTLYTSVPYPNTTKRKRESNTDKHFIFWSVGWKKEEEKGYNSKTQLNFKNNKTNRVFIHI